MNQANFSVGSGRNGFISPVGAESRITGRRGIQTVLP